MNHDDYVFRTVRQRHYNALLISIYTRQVDYCPLFKNEQNFVNVSVHVHCIEGPLMRSIFTIVYCNLMPGIIKLLGIWKYPLFGNVRYGKFHCILINL